MIKTGTKGKIKMAFHIFHFLSFMTIIYILFFKNFVAGLFLFGIYFAIAYIFEKKFIKINFNLDNIRLIGFIKCRLFNKHRYYKQKLVDMDLGDVEFEYLICDYCNKKFYLNGEEISPQDYLRIYKHKEYWVECLDVKYKVICIT